MLFNSFTYLVFLPCVVALYWLSPERLRKPLLLIASYIFYMNWNAGYGLLILSLTIANYFFGLAIDRATVKKRLLLVLSLIFNVGCLSYFKYTNLLIDTFAHFLQWFGTLSGSSLYQTWHPTALDIILPLGISFFTFEFIHYTVDVYRGSKPVKNFFDFALFGAFFPSQISGPIKRFQDFVQQLNDKIVFSGSTFSEGAFLIFQGLFKKIALGDNLAILANYGFSNIANLPTIDAWIAALAFTFQIYFDFSGYTDIGRGSALVLGYRVPENFNLPYLAANVTEFWRRWHMSLSFWLRDYLYIAMGGSRGSKWNGRRNLVLTMLLGGLWHGASWHYVIFGGIHGVALVVHKMWHDFVSSIPFLARIRPHAAWHWAGVGGTFLFWTLALLMFRATTAGEAVQMLIHMIGLQQVAALQHMLGAQVTATATAALPQLLFESTVPASMLTYGAYVVIKECLHRFSTEPAHALHTVSSAVCRWWHETVPVRVVAYAAVAITILSFAPGKVNAFYYFQF